MMDRKGDEGKGQAAKVPNRKTDRRPKPVEQPIPKNNHASILGLLVAVLVAVAAWFLRGSPLLARVSEEAQHYNHLPPHLRPFPGPKLSALPQFQGQHAEKHLWGTYRSGYYFGLRTRTPKSLLFGMMWVDPQRPDALDNIRHEASQRDGLSKYGWLVHDGESYGRQQLLDEQFNMSTTWINTPSTTSSSSHEGGHSPGGDWGARVTASLRTDLKEERPHADAISFFLYLANEDGSPLTLDLPDQPAHARDGEAIFSGSSPAVGAWRMHVVPSMPEESAEFGTARNTLGIQTSHLHNLTASVRKALVASLYAQHQAGAQEYTLGLPNLVRPRSNVVVLQVTAALPITLDVSFLGGLQHKIKTSVIQQRVAALRGTALEQKAAAAEHAFHTKFESVFGPLAAPPAAPPGTQAMAKAALSNLLGGIGYWYGHSLVDINSNGHTVLPLWDTALYSAVPSRSFFPRGFLWDEGFHQLLIRRWSPGVSRDALAHWLDLMTVDGWIPREQILGEEARSRVPGEFIPQKPNAANPPSLFLPLLQIAHSMPDLPPSIYVSTIGDGSNRVHLSEEERRKDIEFLRAAWPRLWAWYRWLKTSQKGPLPGSFRWRGRTASTNGNEKELNPKTLTSGLDDYPRASHPSEIERHLDLRCWMALAAQATLAAARAATAPAQHIAELTADVALLTDFDSLKKLHWDEKLGQFADWGNHTEAVELIDLTNNNNPNTKPEIRSLSNAVRVTKETPIPQYVPHYGYLSLFPFMLHLIPADSSLLSQQLHKLKDGQEIWTTYGLRSLSAKSSLYQQYNTPHDPPYWRGTIWGNINYLVVKALEGYSTSTSQSIHSEGVGKEARKLAADLRQNILRNLVHQYESTGYIWEQYDDESGQGKGVHPFTGWTALLAVTVAEESATVSS